MEKSEAEKYEKNRLYFCSESRRRFLSFHEKSNIAVAGMNEVVARHMSFISGRNFSQIEDGLYYSNLITSFTRTHFIVIDLIMSSELIEAAVLFRKQMELMSRLEELSMGKNIESLLGKTPHVKNLEFDLNRLYSEYSTISHSSGLKQFQLLGVHDDESGYFYRVFPQFEMNSYVSFYHLFLLVTQYHYWTAEKYEEWFDDYTRDVDCSIYKKFYDAVQEIYTDMSWE